MTSRIPCLPPCTNILTFILFYYLDLKQRFDAGEDPNDPMAGAGGGGGFPGGHPFAQFFQQGAGGAGGFQFHYSHGH
jgi:hypothetical protein